MFPKSQYDVKVIHSKKGIKVGEVGRRLEVKLNCSGTRGVQGGRIEERTTNSPSPPLSTSVSCPPNKHCFSLLPPTRGRIAFNTQSVILIRNQVEIGWGNQIMVRTWQGCYCVSHSYKCEHVLCFIGLGPSAFWKLMPYVPVPPLPFEPLLYGLLFAALSLPSLTY